MSRSLIPLVCIGLATYGWITLFCRVLHEHGYSVSRWQRYIIFAVLVIAVLLSVTDVEKATNPFLQAR